jgi:hypothetical protein
MVRYTYHDSSSADIVAFHPYGQRPEPDWPHPDSFFGYVGNLLNGYFEAGQGRKLWITEMGSPERDLGDDRLPLTSRSGLNRASP